MKVRRRKRSVRGRYGKRGDDLIEERRAELKAEVERGLEERPHAVVHSI